MTKTDQLESNQQMASAKLIYDEYTKMQKTLDAVNLSILESRKDLALLDHIVMLMPYQNRRRHETVYGPIYSSVLDPREDTVYFQKDSQSDRFWQIFIWFAAEKQWYWVDTTEPYVPIFWHKSETEELKNAIGMIDGPNWVVIPLERIRRSVETAFSVFA